LSTAIRVVFSLLGVLLLTGCAPFGLIFTNTVVPYSKEFKGTQVGTKRCVINNYQVKEPVTGFNLYAEWSTSFILDEARKAGIKDIYYIDKKTLSILGGVYKRESLIIYGD
jgi:hypothetical protein